MLSFVTGCFTGIVIIGFITRVCPRFMEYFVKDTNELPIDVNYIINLIEDGELKRLDDIIKNSTVGQLQ